MPTQPAEPRSLEQVLDRIDAAGQQEDEDGRVQLRTIFEEVGERSFGPLLLLAGLVTLAPVLGDIPGVPSIMGILVLLISAQLLIGRKHFWLPNWILNRSVSRRKLDKALGWLRRPARWADRFPRRRLAVLTGACGRYITAIVCAIIGLAAPFMEFVPFSANLAGAALTAFGLGLVARDGLFEMIALIFFGGMVAFVAYGVL